MPCVLWQHTQAFQRRMGRSSSQFAELQCADKYSCADALGASNNVHHPVHAAVKVRVRVASLTKHHSHTQGLQSMERGVKVRQ